MKEQRLLFGHLKIHNFTDENHVVAAIIPVCGTAVETGRARAEMRRAVRAQFIRDRAKLVIF